MRKKLFTLFFPAMFLFQSLLAQDNINVSGRVTGEDNLPLIGVSVTVSGSSTATATGNNGSFSIAAPSNGSLVFSNIGYITQVVKIDGRSSFDILMASETKGLNEVVVTGYTSQKRKDIIGSVAVVDMKAMKEVPATSALQAMQGQAAGVDIINNGQPGAGSTIFIRGITGFSNAPLVLIDGIQGSITNVPANDIESIQVLKDAGAASIYGARGSNGVIIITTKKGKSGKPTITYDSYYNLQIPHSGKDWNLMTTEEYAKTYFEINPSTKLFPGGQIPDYLYRFSATGRGVANEGDPLVDPSLYNYDPQDYNNNYLIAKVVKNGRTDMYDEIFNPALMMNHSITASGGTENAKYLATFGYLDQQGTMLNTYLKRYTARVNTEFNLSPNIRIGENLNVYYQNNPQKASNGGFGPIVGAFTHLPFLPVYDIAGNYAGPYVGPGDFEVGDWGNAKADVDLVDNNRRRNYGIIGSAYVAIDFLKDFSFKSTFGGVIDNYYNQTFLYNSYWTQSGGNNTNTLTENSGYSFRAQWTNNITYRKNIDKHNITVLAGSESVENQARNQTGSGQKFFSTDYNYLVLDNAQIRNLPSSRASEDALFSLYGKLDYSFDEKYLLSATVRRDGFSAFGRDSKYGIFPAFAVGWRISQEKFMQPITWINDLKIRGSYGSMGNKEGINPANAYTTYGQDPQRSYYDIMGTGSSILQGFYPNQNGNTFTSWEKNKLSNIGLDATLFNNSLELSIEYYKKATDGLLRPVQAPATAGEASSPFVNIGNIENSGVDLSVMYRKNISADWGFNAGINLTSYKNEIVSIPDPGYFDEGIVRFEEGHPMSSFFGYQVLGVFKDQAEVDNHATQQDAEPGRYKYLDANGDGNITTEDRVHMGDPNPTFTMGLNLGARYKNFSVSAQLYTAQGFEIYNSTYEFLGAWERGTSNKSRTLLNAWTPSNTVTNVKKNELSRNFSNTGVNNSAWIEDGSFIRLRSLQLAYSVESAKLSSIGLSGLRVYVQGTNLFLISKYSGLDPEVYGSGVGFRGNDAGAYTQDKGFTLGLNVSF